MNEEKENNRLVRPTEQAYEDLQKAKKEVVKLRKEMAKGIVEKSPCSVVLYYDEDWKIRTFVAAPDSSEVQVTQLLLSATETIKDMVSDMI